MGCRESCSITIAKVGDIMNGKMISIFMQASTISVLFVVLLVVFFIALVAMTIALFASRSGKSDDDYDEDEYEDFEEETSDKKGARSNVKKTSHKEDDKIDISSIFAEADKEAAEDSAFTDSVFSDSAFTDSAFSDSAFSDSAFLEAGDASGNMDHVERGYMDKIKSDAADTYADAESFSDKDRYEEENDDQYDDEYDDEYGEVGDTDELIATDEQREFIEQLNKRDAEEKVNVSAGGTFSDSAFSDSAFDEQNMSAFEVPERISSEDIDASVKEAVALGKAVSGNSFSRYSQMEQPEKGTHSGRKKKTNVPITDDFYWFNKLDVEEKPDYKTKEMYYHHFNVPEDCIEELLIEMYDCALVRTEEIRYIAYGIEPRTISMKEIMGNGNSGRNQKRLKEPSAEDMLKIYAKWCSYVDELFEKVEIHADDYTTEKIRTLLCEFGRSDVDEILEGK